MEWDVTLDKNFIIWIIFNNISVLNDSFKWISSWSECIYNICGVDDIFSVISWWVDSKLDWVYINNNKEINNDWEFIDKLTE